MLKPFWKSARIVLEYRKELSMAVLGSLLSACSLGAGIGMMLPTVRILLSDDKDIRPMVLEFFSHRMLPQAGRDLGQWIVAHMPASVFQTFLLVMGVMAVLTVMGNFGRYINELYAITLASRASMEWRRRTFRHLIRVPLDTSFKLGNADHISRLTGDTRTLSEGYYAILGRTMYEVSRATVAAVVAILVSWRLSIGAVVFGVLVFALLRKFGKKILRASHAAMDQRGKMIGSLSESLGGLNVVKVHGAEGYERRRFRRINRSLFNQEMRMRQIKAFASPLIETLTALGVVGMAILAAWYIISQGVRGEEFIAVLFALGIAGQAIRPLSSLNNTLHESAAAATRLLEILDLPTEPIGRDERNHLPRLPRHTRSVAFDHVTYAYPGQPRPAVQDVSLDVRHGQTIAIVGSNGSGKTTLMSMIPRLLVPQSGRVMIDGVDVAGVNLRRLREQIAVVSQQTVLFEGTIAENIAYGRRHTPMPGIIAAARAAFAEEFIAGLPHAYQTRLGEDGSGLSGGQRQRLCIARAILRDPAILILDEATSQIDADSEAKINVALREFRAGRTTFIIAHRLSTVVDADVIVVMDQARIIDQGTHAQLMSRCEVYQTLTRTQLQPSLV